LAEYRLSQVARLDLFEIADYTVDTWGMEQANRYLDGLDQCFKRLVENSEMGRPCNQIRPGYRRIDYEKHVVFYRIDEVGVFISRVLHQRMLPSRHLIEDA